MAGKNWGRMPKIVVLILFSLFLFGCVSSKNVNDDEILIQPPQVYSPPKVEDTPYFKRLRALLEADGFLYNRYETGEGIIVWGNRGRASKGYGNKDEGIKRLPAGNVNKSYFVSWEQYFGAFSDMHRTSFEDETVREIKKAVDKIVLDTDYDYARLYTLPSGIRWVFSPGVNLGTSDDYSNLVIEKTAAIPGVKEVNMVSSSSGNHSWNEIVLEDDRILYIDAAWYDTNGYTIDSDTGNYSVDHTPHYFPTMFTFDRELFSLGGTHYNWGDAVVISGKSNAAPAATARTAKAAKNAQKAKAVKKDGDDDDDGRNVGFIFNFGKIYINGWKENAVSLGLPVQLGVEFTFSKFAFSFLADAGAGLGVTSVTELTSPVVEWYYGGFGEFYIMDKRFGLGFGGGMIDSYVLEIPLKNDYPKFLDFLNNLDVPSPDPFYSYYLRYGFILRGKKHKMTLYGQYFGSGNMGFGIILK